MACVGIGSKLVTREILDSGDFAALVANVRRVVGWIDEIRDELAGG